MSVQIREIPHGVMFHHFHDEGVYPKGQGSITAKQFEDIILYLKEHYVLLQAKDWYNRAIEGTLEKREVCISFDDNLLCQYDVALPVLIKHNLTAFWFSYSSPFEGVVECLEMYRYFRSTQFADFNDFFVAFFEAVKSSEYAKEVEDQLADFIPKDYLASFSFYSDNDRIFRYTRDQILKPKRYNEIMDLMIEQSPLSIKEIADQLWMNKDQMRHLEQLGHIIGLHSHTHPTDIKALSKEGQLKEYSTNMKALSSFLDQNIITSSHPCNSYNEDTKDVLKSLGIKLAFRANMDEGYTSEYEYPRIDHILVLNEV